MTRSRRAATLAAVAAAALLPAAGPARAAEPVADSHFHVGNYAMQGVSLRRLLDEYMGDRVARAAVFGIPLQQKWDRFEHYEGDRIAPNYYLGPRAGMYYYAFIDAMVALGYQRLPAADRARLDPMIVGFNPMDQYGVDHVRRCLLLFPGVFSGVGEITVHKEVVDAKIDDDLLRTSIPVLVPLPPDAGATTRNSLYNPALQALLAFNADAGLLTILHNDLYPASVDPRGIVVSSQPDRTHVPGLIRLCRSVPGAAVIWAHTGLGRFVQPTAVHLKSIAEVLDACPSWNVDLSWDVVQEYLVRPAAGMPKVEEWASFLARYQDRVLWGSDTVAFTRNRVDGEGRALLGTPLPVAEYRRYVELLGPLWDAVGPEVTAKVRYRNHVRLFDAARTRVRAWEAAHAADDPWSLPRDP